MIPQFWVRQLEICSVNLVVHMTGWKNSVRKTSLLTFCFTTVRHKCSILTESLVRNLAPIEL